MIKVLLETRKGHLVSLFILAEIGQFLLNSIIGQMNLGVSNRVCVGRIILLTTGSNIAFLEQVAPTIVSNEHPYADIELPLVN